MTRIRTTDWSAVAASSPANAQAARDYAYSYDDPYETEVKVATAVPVVDVQPETKSPVAKKTDAPSRVRFAERCDLDDVLFLCRELHAENGLFEMSDDRVRDVLMSHYDRTGGMIGVIGEPGCLEGAIVMRMSTMWYSDQTVLEELFSFVLPEFRRSNNAKDLIDFAKRCAEAIGVPLMIGIISNHRTAAKVELYRRRLGAPAGAFFVTNAA